MAKEKKDLFADYLHKNKVKPTSKKIRQKKEEVVDVNYFPKKSKT